MTLVLDVHKTLVEAVSTIFVVDIYFCVCAALIDYAVSDALSPPLTQESWNYNTGNGLRSRHRYLRAALRKI